MTTTAVGRRYADLLKHVDSDLWPWFVIGAAEVIERHTGESEQKMVLGLLEAKRRGEDLRAFKWRALLWIRGAEADFYERLERATLPTAGDVDESST